MSPMATKAGIDWQQRSKPVESAVMPIPIDIASRGRAGAAGTAGGGSSHSPGGSGAWSARALEHSVSATHDATEITAARPVILRRRRGFDGREVKSRTSPLLARHRRVKTYTRSKLKGGL